MIDENIVTLSDKGELLVTLQTGYNVHFKISSWEDGLNFFIHEQGEWVQENIDAGIILATRQSIDSSDPTEQFVAHIPEKLRQVVSTFHHKQFSLLRLVAQYPQLQDIVLHSPTLSWMIVVYAEQQGWPIEKVAEILQLKRTHIIEVLFATKSKQMVKLINKIKLNNGSEGEFKFLFKMLTQQQIVSAFNHWDNVSIQALKVAERRPHFLNTRLLLNEVDNTKSNQANLLRFLELHTTHNDVQRMSRCLNRAFTPQMLENVPTGEQLRRLHDRLIHEYNNTEQGRLAIQERLRSEGVIEGKDESYPISPLGDLDGFVQIKNHTELAEEGIYMHHCVGSYHHTLHNSHRYIYKLFNPQRATVELNIDENSYKVMQFKLAKNRNPESQTHEYLHKLLSAASKDKNLSGA